VKLTAAGSTLLVIDLQRRPMPAISGAETPLANPGRLVEAARLLTTRQGAT
jgi:hypothetical protein